MNPATTAGITFVPKRYYPPRACVTCREPIESPTRLQVAHRGECSRVHVAKRQRAWVARQRGKG